MNYKEERLLEYAGYGYAHLGEHMGLDIVAKRFEDDGILIMSISDKVVTQLPITREQVKMILNL